jgi:hypothetical protein
VSSKIVLVLTFPFSWLTGPKIEDDHDDDGGMTPNTYQGLPWVRTGLDR